MSEQVKTPRQKILSRVSAEDFIGRSKELDQILRHAKNTQENKGLLVLSAFGDGCSELLRQVYDQLFHEQGEIIPFYFSFNQTDETVVQAARRFLQSFILQTVAFRRKNPQLLNYSPEIWELTEQTTSFEDLVWVGELVLACQREIRYDEAGFVRNCLSSPFRAATYGSQSVILINNWHFAEKLHGETNLIEEIKELYSRSKVPFVLAGKRRFVMKTAQSGDNQLTNVEYLRLEKLSDNDGKLLVEKLATKYAVKINDQTQDLLTQQFEANPRLLNAIFTAAREKRIDLDSFRKTQEIYTDEILGGQLKRFYDTIFNQIVPAHLQNSLLKLLYNSLQSETSTLERETWKNQVMTEKPIFEEIIKNLDVFEIITSRSELINVNKENEIFKDYLKSRFSEEVLGKNRALVVKDMLATSLKRSLKLMSDYYRKSSIPRLQNLLSVFNCQEIPQVLFDYAEFKAHYKGETADKIGEMLKKETDFIKLPQIVYTAKGTAFYPQLKQFLDEERCSVALGFDFGNYTDENEVVWIMAEIYSKLEASKELTSFWCDRLEMIAEMCSFSNYRIWLITPEGFSPEAVEVLRERKAFGSSHGQLEILVKELEAKDVLVEQLKANEYELVIPMGEDTELISVCALECIARRHNFSIKTINQIKTALIEACINATEHSLSPDRKIYQKFAFEEDKIIITISNRGLKIPLKKTQPSENNNERRGWGIKLMKTLMDEVEFVEVDDGTQIVLVKYLN